MKARDGATRSIWTEGVDRPTHPQPSASDKAEIVVVGAGISGLTAAYLLAGDGHDVLVVDEGPVGAGQTERTSAHLASIIDDRFSHLEKLHGQEVSRLAHQSHSAAIDRIETISRTEKIDCDFRRLPAYLFLGPGDKERTLDEEFAAAQRAGVESEDMLDHVGYGLNIGKAIRFDHQAAFHPLRYLVGLAAAAEKRGVRIRVGRRVIDVAGAKDGKPVTITFENDLKIECKSAVVATNTPTPINDWMGVYLKQASYRTYVVGLSVPHGRIPDALYWDTADPYHYVRLIRDADKGDVLLVGGEDHKTGQGGESDERFKKLADWARGFFPAAGEEVSRWSGQVQEPSDGLAYIGVAPTKGSGVYVITGDSGMGLTHGTLGAMLVTDLIAGRANPWEKMYEPTRKSLNREVVTENLNTTTQYVDYLTPGDEKSEDDITKGEGALIRSGLKKLAVYRDDAGKLHRMSAICTHLQCIVQWNALEKSWDCPCHGSRFDPCGKMVMGPAVDDLPKAEE